jgi:hypothetical protein
MQNPSYLIRSRHAIYYFRYPVAKRNRYSLIVRAFQLQYNVVMEEDYKQYKTKIAKRDSLLWDIVAVWLVATLLSIFFQLDFINLAGFECTIPYLEQYDLDTDIGDWKENVETFCQSNFIVHMGGYVLFVYILLAALCVASPIKATPVQYLVGHKMRLYAGTYYTNAKGEQPELHEAIRLILVSRHLFPWYLLYLYYMIYDFKTSLYNGGGASWVILTLVIGLRLYERFSSSKLLWDERFSGLRIHLTKDAIAQIDEQASKLYKWYNRISYKVEIFGERKQITQILIFVFLGFFSFNFIRDVAPPTNYNEVVYSRPAPAWEDNAYFALAGLDAPEGVTDFYEYGRQRIIFHASRWAEYKKKIPVPYVHDVPTVEYNLFKPYEPVEKLGFDKQEIENWRCLYNLDAKLNMPTCPSMEDVLSLRQSNSTLWQRFQRLADNRVFSMPDHFVDTTYSSQDLIKLVNLHAVYLLDLQSKGYNEKAMQEWVKYMNLYKGMVSAHSVLVDKAIFLIVFKTHADVLETLIYNDPQIAVAYGDEIREAILIKDVSFFRAGQMIVDDWRGIEPLFIPTMGMSANQKRELISCFKENQKLAEWPAKGYFKPRDDRICEAEFPNDLGDQMLKNLLESGNVITNIIHSLLMGGILKGEELIGNMHRNIADFQMANVAMELIRNEVRARDVSSYLNDMPKEYWNPITEEPFLWDEQNGWLYYPNLEDPDLVPNRMFRVNLGKE